MGIAATGVRTRITSQRASTHAVRCMGTDGNWHYRDDLLRQALCRFGRVVHLCGRVRPDLVELPLHGGHIYMPHATGQG